MSKAVTSLFVGMAMLAGAGQALAETKQWYIDHDAEREARVKVCKNDAALTATADCQSAIRAAASVWALGKDANDNSSPKINF